MGMWQIQTAVAFRDKAKSVAFEKYLKSQSGRAFAKKHFQLACHVVAGGEDGPIA